MEEILRSARFLPDLSFDWRIWRFLPPEALFGERAGRVFDPVSRGNTDRRLFVGALKVHSSTRGALSTLSLAHVPVSQPDLGRGLSGPLLYPTAKRWRLHGGATFDPLQKGATWAA